MMLALRRITNGVPGITSAIPQMPFRVPTAGSGLIQVEFKDIATDIVRGIEAPRLQ